MSTPSTNTTLLFAFLVVAAIVAHLFKREIALIYRIIDHLFLKTSAGFELISEGGILHWAHGLLNSILLAKHRQPQQKEVNSEWTPCVKEGDRTLRAARYSARAYLGSKNHSLRIDHENQEIVLAVRGSANLEEVLANVECWTVPYGGGVAHKSYARIADAIWDAGLLPKLKNATPNKDYKWIFCGHSQGGSIANLLTIRLLEEEPELATRHGVHCYAFGAPPTYASLSSTKKHDDAEAARMAKLAQHTTSFAHGHDIFPFMGGALLRLANARLRQVHKARQQMSWMELYHAYIGTPAAEDKNQAALMEACNREVAVEEVDHLDLRRDLILPAAQIVWLNQPGRTSGMTLHTDATTFVHTFGIEFHPRMILDHLPGGYKRALQQELQKQQANSH